jgi:photosystem II stability/assembly factor-like uncharacterized protein
MPLGRDFAAAATGQISALDAVACPTASECIAVGGSDHVLVTQNGGLTWSAQSVPTGHYLYGIACLSKTRCVAVGDAGTVLVSARDGRTWSRAKSGTGEPLSAVACPGDGHCYAVGDRVVLATSDDGRRWQRVASDNKIIVGVACGSRARCAAVTSDSENDLHTSDGTLWSAAAVPVFPFLALFPMNGISCSAMTCVAVGGNGLVERSLDGGTSWSFDFRAVTSKGLYGVTCPTADRCVAVGSAGTILTTDDRGATWTLDPSPTNATLLGVTCSSSDDCLTVGSGGIVLSTVDGGTQWIIRNGTAAPTPGISVLVVGDSFAHSLALYVGRNSVAYGVSFFDGGLDGCSLSRGSYLEGSVVEPGLGACASTGSGWPAQYKADITKDRPDLSLLVLGPWDLNSRLIGKRWLSPGQAAYDTYYSGQITAAIRILTSGGGRVAITTVPYVNVSFGQCVPVPATMKDCPTEAERVTALNAVARQVAAEYPGRVTVIDLSQRLSSHGRFTRTLDGVVVRAADGVHLSEPGGEWLTSWLVPLIISADH